jgi:uncharacterized protein (TIGR03437 family)
MIRICVLVLALALARAPMAGQNFIQATPSVPIVFTTETDAPISAVSTIGIGGSAVGLQFKFDRVEPRRNDPPNFVVLSASGGSIPAFIQVGLNERVIRQMAPGAYGLDIFFSTVDQTPPSRTSVSVQLNLAGPATPVIQSVVNTASYQSKICPGAMVSIFGAHLGQPTGSTSFNEFGLYPTTVAGTTVTFNGISAALLYVGTGQINALVPSGVAGQRTAEIVVKRITGSFNQSSPTFSVSIMDTSPAIFTSTQTGTGQGAVLIASPSDLSRYTYNSTADPAPPGSVMTFFATGMGLWRTTPQDGSIFLGPIFPIPALMAPISLTISGQPARLIYAGPALYQVWGLLQINAIVPDNAPSGAQPLVLKVGDNDNSEQKVTIAIK